MVTVEAGGQSDSRPESREDFPLCSVRQLTSRGISFIIEISNGTGIHEVI